MGQVLTALLPCHYRHTKGRVHEICMVSVLVGQRVRGELRSR